MSIGPGRGARPGPGNGEPAAAPAGLPRRVGGRLSRLPLWLKLTTAVVCLTGVGLGVLGVAGVSAFRGALLRQVDQQVNAGAGQLAGHTFIVGPTGGPAINGPGNLVVQVLGQDGQRLERVGPGAGVGAIIPPSPAWIMSHTGHPVSVQAGGQTWRVILKPVRYQTKYYVPSEYGADNYAVADASQATVGVPGTLVVGTTLTGLGDRVSQLSAEELGIGAAVTALVAALVIALTRRSMNSLAEVGGLVRAVARGQWSRRLPEHQGSTEMSGIARSLNLALTREEETARAHAAEQAARAAATRRMSERLTETTRELHGPLSVITGLARQHPRRNAPTPAEAGRMMKRVAQEATRMADTIDTLSPPAPSDTQP
jgi:two-component system, OmpR family, sensor kinase